MTICSLSVSMLKTISISRFFLFPNEYLSGLELESIQLSTSFKVSQKPLFLLCILRNGNIFVEGREAYIHASCFLPLYPHTDIPIVLLFHPNHSISPADLFIPFKMLHNVTQSPSIRGVVIRKALSVLPDSSYLLSLSVEKCKKEVVIRVDPDHSRYCQLYLPIGTEIVLSNYKKTYSFMIRLKSRFSRIDLTPSSTISLHSLSSLAIPNRFPIFPMDASFLFVEREAKWMSHWKGKVIQRISPTLFLLDNSVFVTSVLPMPFQPSDLLLLFNVHLIYYSLVSIKLICMCLSSTVFSILL